MSPVHPVPFHPQPVLVIPLAGVARLACWHDVPHLVLSASAQWDQVVPRQWTRSLAVSASILECLHDRRPLARRERVGFHQSFAIACIPLGSNYLAFWTAPECFDRCFRCRSLAVFSPLLTVVLQFAHVVSLRRFLASFRLCVRFASCLFLWRCSLLRHTGFAFATATAQPFRIGVILRQFLFQMTVPTRSH